MNFIRIFLSLILGFILSGIWFGLNFIMKILIQKFDIPWLSYMSTLFASIIPIFFIASTVGLYPIQIGGIKDIRVYIVAVITIIITTVIITRKKSVEYKKGKDILIWGFDGIMMEIPQRLMMQSFVYGILKLLGVSSLSLYTIIATALIWCMGIVIQIFLLKKQFDEDVIFDILASLFFSLGIGYVYQQTGLIVIPMSAHFCERILSCYIFNKRYI